MRADVSSHLPTQHAQVTYFRTCPLASMACGDFHVLALGQDGRVYAWGYGAEGQGGLGATLHLRCVAWRGVAWRGLFLSREELPVVPLFVD